MNVTNKTLYSTLVSVLISISITGCGGESGSAISSNQNTQLGVNVGFVSGPPAAIPSETVTTFSGPRNNYTITRTATGFAVTDIVGSGGTVKLVNQISAKFSDVTVNLVIGDKSKTISAANLKMLLELYIAFFNRVPDADGMVYWIDQVKNGMTMDQLANNFYNAAIHYTTLTGYSDTMSNADFVKIIYENVLGRSGATAPPAADINYWANDLTSGRATKGTLIATMLNSAHTFAGDATWGWVPQLLDNKFSVGQFFAIEQGLNYATPEESITKTMTIVKKITSSDTSAAKDAINIKDQQFNQTIAYTEPSTNPGNIPAILFAGKAGTIDSNGQAYDRTVDGTGIEARFQLPLGMVADKAGNLYVADFGAHNIRKISPKAVVTNFAGPASADCEIQRLCPSGYADGTGNAARFTYPRGLAMDSIGNLYVGNFSNIRKISPTGVVSTLAGPDSSICTPTTICPRGYINATGTAARFSGIMSMATDANNNVYVVDSGNNAVRKITPTGVVSTLFKTERLSGAIALDAQGNIYVGNGASGGGILKLTTAGVSSVFVGNNVRVFANDIAIDATGTLFASDFIGAKINKITPTGTLTASVVPQTFVGNASGFPSLVPGAGNGGSINNGYIAISGTSLYIAQKTAIGVVNPRP